MQFYLTALLCCRQQESTMWYIIVSACCCQCDVTSLLMLCCHCCRVHNEDVLRGWVQEWICWSVASQLALGGWQGLLLADISWYEDNARYQGNVCKVQISVRVGSKSNLGKHIRWKHVSLVDGLITVKSSCSQLKQHQLVHHSHRRLRKVLKLIEHRPHRSWNQLLLIKLALSV